MEVNERTMTVTGMDSGNMVGSTTLDIFSPFLFYETETQELKNEERGGKKRAIAAYQDIKLE